VVRNLSPRGWEVTSWPTIGGSSRAIGYSPAIPGDRVEQVKAAFGVDIAKVVDRLDATEGKNQAGPLASRPSQ